MRMRKSAFLFLLLSFWMLPGVSASAQSNISAPCPNMGERQASAADIPLMRAAGYPPELLNVGQCWNPSSPYVGQEAGEVKLFLQKNATKNANISCLNPEFAKRLEDLMESAPTGIPKVTDGYRSPAAQANLPAGSTKVGPCGSYHQYGMAADFNLADKKTLDWMRINASRFGLSPVTNANPVTGCTARGFCDSGHIQIAGPLPSRDQCGTCASGGTGDGTLPYVRTASMPDDIYSSPYQTPLSNGLFPPPPPPFTQSSYSAQQPFGSTLPTSSSVPSGTTQGGTGPQICSPRFSCESNIMYYHTSACAKVQYEVCKNGCSGTQCALPQSATSSTSTLSSIFSSTAPTSSTIGQSIIPSLTEGFGALLNATSASVSTGSSIGDLLSSFAQQFISGQGETSVGPKATSVPVSLSATLAASTSIRTAVPTAVGTTGPVTVSTLTSEETFTTAQPQVTAQPDRTAMARILELFRSILLWALSVLRLRAG